MSMDLDGVAARAGLDRETVIRRYEAVLLEVAGLAWGPRRQLEAHYNEESGVVDVFQVFRVVEVVEERVREVPLARWAEEGFAAGDELIVQVFYRDEDAESARVHCAEHPGLPPFEVLAAGLPAPEGPPWLRELWPVRRLVWRWDHRVELPSFADALDRFDRWLRQAAPAEVVDALTAGPAESLEALRGRPAAQELMAFYARFGGACRRVDEDGVEGPYLSILGAPLVPPEQGQEWAEIQRSYERWEPTWQPFLAWIEASYAVDLEDAGGRVIGWRRGDGLTLEAPSFGAWLGLLVVGAEAGVLEWDGDGVSVNIDHHGAFGELRAHLLPGAPRSLP